MVSVFERALQPAMNSETESSLYLPVCCWLFFVYEGELIPELRLLQGTQSAADVLGHSYYKLTPFGGFLLIGDDLSWLTIAVACLNN